jgi:hypothetical protein
MVVNLPRKFLHLLITMCTIDETGVRWRVREEEHAGVSTNEVVSDLSVGCSCGREGFVWLSKAEVTRW